MSLDAPMKTAADALAQAYNVDERCARLVAALLACRAVLVTIEHEADTEVAAALAGIEIALRREPNIAYRGWSISYDPPPIGARNCDWQFSHPDFDASWEGEEDGFVGNGLCGYAATLGEAIAEIDERIATAQEAAAGSGEEAA
jgi:hypothetical protein